MNPATLRRLLAAAMAIAFAGAAVLAARLLRARPSPVITGLDALFQGPIAELRGKRIAVVCNRTAVDRRGIHLVDRLRSQSGVRLAAIFAPEHGFRADVPDGGDPAESIDPDTGIPVYGLYGERLAPTPRMLAGIDVLLYDIQDVGARFYTYISTLGLVMEAAAAAGVELWVLDRPNPIGGTAVQGPVLEPARRSFVGLYPIPARYGLTVGELARMIAGERWVEVPAGYAPRVVPLRGWSRERWFDELGLPWVAPSPNMLRLSTAALYPGTCLLEGTNLSEGRGTENPFEWIGAPWIDGARLAAELERRQIAGAAFQPIEFVPRAIAGRTAAVKYRGEPCRGVAIRVTDRRTLDPVAVAVHLLHAVRALHGPLLQWRLPGIDDLYGSDRLRRDLEAGLSPAEIIAAWQPGLEAFGKLRARYLIYR